MATPRIGPYTLTQLSGEIPVYRNEVRTHARPGTDGYTYVLQGKRSEPFEVRTVALVASLSAARQARADYAALCGTFAELRTTDGDSCVVMVHDVQTSIRPLLQSSDGSDAMIAATWRLQRSQ